MSDENDVAIPGFVPIQIEATGHFRPSANFDEIVRVMEEKARNEGSMHINLPGPLPFAPKHLFLNDIEYVRVDPEGETDAI